MIDFLFHPFLVQSAFDVLDDDPDPSIQCHVIDHVKHDEEKKNFKRNGIEMVRDNPVDDGREWVILKKRTIQRFGSKLQAICE